MRRLFLVFVLGLVLAAVGRLAVAAPITHAFMGAHKSIKWVSHAPDHVAPPVEGIEGEDDDLGQIDEGQVDLDGDKQPETIKVVWGPGVTDHSLQIEVYKDGKQINALQPLEGIQPNYKVEDIDQDNTMEIVIWGGLWDFRLPGEGNVTDETYEGHSDRHRYVVATYKFMRGRYYFQDVYTTTKKYDPFCEEQPARE